MILISACLAGVHCRYDGGNNETKEMVRWVQKGKAILACPEQLGGLSTPRLPCEIVDGDGGDVLCNKAMVINKEGQDQTRYFIKGAEETLRIAKLYGVKTAILKARSPSCGSGCIYDGSFSGGKKKGDGITAAILKQNGIKVLDEENFREYIK
ncbi:DUF523 domain-containing protein [Clostridiaceae bacterium 35-E11]